MDLSQSEALRSATSASEESCLAALARYAVLFDVPIALVSLVDRGRQWFKACYGLNARERSRDLSFCAHAILSDEVTVVPDATQERLFLPVR